MNVGYSNITNTVDFLLMIIGYLVPEELYMAALPEPQQGTAAGWQNRDFV